MSITGSSSSSIGKKVWAFLQPPQQQNPQLTKQDVSTATTSTPLVVYPCNNIINNNNNNIQNPTTATTTTAGTRILACSVSRPHSNTDTLFAEFDRKLCEDRKLFFEHLYPASLTKSTIRITLMQATYFLSDYMNDQLKLDLEHDERVAEGRMTRVEADQEADEWEKREWTKRWEAFPEKLASAIIKFHSIVFVMRIYEYMLEALHWVDEKTLDILTQDTFKSAQRITAKNEGQGNTNTTWEVMKQMFSVCKSANFIGYLADYSVHQVILCYGYYGYIVQHRHKRKQKNRQQHLTAGENNKNKKDSEKEKENGATNNDDQNNNNDNDNNMNTNKNKNKNNDETSLEYGSIALSMLKRSTLLGFSRGLSLLVASAGGAVGTVIWPGWGTMAGCNLGDSLVGIFMDELNVGSPASSK